MCFKKRAVGSKGRNVAVASSRNKEIENLRSEGTKQGEAGGRW